MIEIPEASAMARQLNQTVCGQVVWHMKAAASPHGFAWYQGDPAAYPDLMVGKAIAGAEARGGKVHITLDDVILTLGEGVNIRYHPPGRPLPKKHQLLMTFGNGASLVCSIQMYGGIWAYRAGEVDSIYILGGKTPCPLTDAFDEPYFRALIDARTMSLSAKAFLATEQRIPGLGNGVLQDILLNAGIHPAQRISALDDAQITRLYQAVVGTLREMDARGGRDTERDLFGSPGGYATRLSRKTVGGPCAVCGDVVLKKAYMGGSIYYCATCQPPPAKR